MAMSLASEVQQLAILASDPGLAGPEGVRRYLQALADAANRIADGDRSAAIVFNTSKREVSHVARTAMGWAPGPLVFPFQELQDGLTGWTLRTGEVAVSPKSPPDPRESEVVQQRRAHARAGAILVAPLVGHGPAQGTITVIRRLDQPDFADDDRDTLGLLARFGALDLEALAQRWDKGPGPIQNLLSNLSHELRTPLNGILGFSQLLESGPLSPAQEPMVANIVRSGQRLLETVDNLLDLAQFDTGRVQWEDTLFAPKSVFESITTKFRPAAEEKGLRFEVHWDPRVPTVSRGDPVRMGQAWGHVLSNAIKFTASGSVTVSLSMEDRPDSPGLFRFTVADTGMGFPPGEWSGTFVPFRQEDGSWTRKFGGNGLGLALCDRIARALGGGLSIDSLVGEGATVTVRIAVKAPQPDGFVKVLY